MLVTNGKKTVLTNRTTFEARYKAMGYRQVKAEGKQPARAQKDSRGGAFKGGKESGGAGK